MPEFTEACPSYAPFFGAIGVAVSIIFSCFGAAYGTAKSGVGICTMGVLRPELILKNVIPVVMVPSPQL
jgi:V-type H+-transporting ATPase proteolipid subunit